MKLKTESEVIWNPSQSYIENSQMHQYMNWLKDKKGLTFTDYNELWKWSVNELEEFWKTIWDFSGVKAFRKYDQVLEGRMPAAKWFTGSRINFAENILLKNQGDKIAIHFRSETIKGTKISWNELQEKVASLAHSLKGLGVKPGDRVASFMPNIPETVIAFLATASIGAIWSSCSPDFGASSVVDRFKQIEPVVLFAVDGYQYNGKLFDKSAAVSQLQRDLGSSLKHTILVNYLEKDQLDEKLDDVIPWEDFLMQKAELVFESVPFDHPLWIVYSSGTTGLPKPIVHGHGGILLEQFKTMLLHKNLSPNQTFFQFTTTGWVMWNVLVGSLFSGATIVLYDGSPSYPNLEVLWELVEELGVTYFGIGAPFLLNSLKVGVIPKERYDLSKLEVIDSTGAPLSEEGYRWVYENVKKDLWLSSSSGGTDVCTSFVAGVPILPVIIGEIQGRCLGVEAQAFDEEGNPLVNEVGELVITKPMPSMPLYFWNDNENKRYHSSYFDMYPNIWMHGDWIRFDENGSSVIFGRSDSTINRSGVRTGTSDIYRIVEGLDGIMDSLVIDLEVLGRQTSLLLFVVLRTDQLLDAHMEKKIREQIRTQISPRFMPDKIYSVEQIPKTLNGKKMEVPIRKLLLGFEFQKVINPDSMNNPESLPFYINLANELIEKNKEKIF
ncbi:acetoacetate--CoA ligase [Psychrobacillus sp. OK032]|uniref:acetoacetate--CoA ligase n=1 Tax=Psychrobacillus sp. OK032 TaxID=1884358 RepID=UPI0008B1ED85|nr:acetoacetate--CoA ligase [Psychrobacillus sp. OK032]SER82404.1 acetoacetyl-CoA synthetase [Psychrobacillus sp. OK032]